MEQRISREMDFFMYLIEQYAAQKGRSTGEVLREWDALGLTDLIYDMYERYHVERLENAFDDIDALVRERRGEVVGGVTGTSSDLATLTLR